MSFGLFEVDKVNAPSHLDNGKYHLTPTVTKKQLISLHKDTGGDMETLEKFLSPRASSPTGKANNPQGVSLTNPRDRKLQHMTASMQKDPRPWALGHLRLQEEIASVRNILKDLRKQNSDTVSKLKAAEKELQRMSVKLRILSSKNDAGVSRSKNIFSGEWHERTISLDS